ncbi:unnamed protein product [Lymnaea stagnalis]|uniref:G-protein coupled receptors family 1 profile domain-containing protein n=1 Tax=Lymnaea stagnalis TaxID=6523 RepID=A0AAV2INS7_LYMST
MGFKDTVNITMTTIAFWDLIRVLCGLAHRLYGPMAWVFPAFGKSWQNITVTNLVYLHVISGNVSYVIGGYVAVERCFCVCFPLKVKTLLTPKLTSFVCVTLSILVFVSLLPILLVFEYRWVYTAQYQTVIAVYQYTHFYSVHGQKFMEGYKYLGFIYPVLSLTAMVFSTVVISYKLQRASRFRKGASAGSKPGTQDRGPSEVTTRDRQVITMLLVVIGVYIVNLVPRVVHFIAMLLEPEYYVLKYYNNIFWVIVYVIFVLDFVNASVNLFIFYYMSTKFRACFVKIFQPMCLSGKA